MNDLTYISEGNEKTECFSFDLPAKRTCPGMTEECGASCYAFNLMRTYPDVNRKYVRNLKFSYSHEFVDYMIEKIPYGCEFRIHVSGDFYSYSYIRKWIEIVSSRPDVTFYAYTRSWRNGVLWGAIQILQTWDNVNINLSVDDETGMPPENMQSFRWCYLTNSDTAPNWLRKEDIVFRSNHIGQKARRKNDIKKGIDPNIRSPLVKRLVGLVCPLEQGQDIPRFSCKKCKLCVDKPNVELVYV